MPSNKRRVGLSLIMLVLSALACATFRAPGDPAPTRPPNVTTPTATLTPTASPTDTPAPTATRTATVVEMLTAQPSITPTPLASGRSVPTPGPGTPLVVPPPSSD